jgi:hypothetical protein
MPGTKAHAGSSFFVLSEIRWLVPCAIGLLALGLRLMGISRYGFDGDEIFSLQAADSTWGHLLSTSIHDKSHPPLFYAALKLWIYLGPADEYWVRVLSVILGVALVPVAFAICREIRLDGSDAVIVLLLLAMNGLLISLSQHARMFVLLELSAAISIVMFIRFVKALGSWRSLSLLTLANVFLVYSHYWGWFVILAEFLIVCSLIREKVVLFILSVSAVAVCFLPWAAAVAAASTRDEKLIGQIAWMGSGVQGAKDYALLFGIFDGPTDFSHATTIGIILFATPIVVFTVQLVKKAKLRVADSQSPLFWTILIVTPLLLTSMAGYLTEQNLWATRHLSIVALSYFILVGLSLAALPTVFLKVLFRCALLAWAIVGSGTSLAETDKKLHWETIAQAIAAGDAVPIYASDYFIICPLEYHLAHLTGRITTVHEEPDLKRIDAERFWFVYRDTTWHGQDPATQLEALHTQIDAQFSTRTASQEITAVLTHKGATTVRGGSPSASYNPPRTPDQGASSWPKKREVRLENIKGCYR